MATTSKAARNGGSPLIDLADDAQAAAGRRLVIQCLHEARATEAALITTLTAHIAMTPAGSYRTLLERHLEETQAQAAAIQRRLDDLGESASLVQTATGAVQGLVGQVLALTKGPIDLLRGKGGEEKLLKNAKDECATEALEIATYDALEALASAVGDAQTARLAARHRTQEERMLAELRRHLPTLTFATVLALAGGQPTYDLADTPAGEAVRGDVG
jgi:ferritin-like metal-binding protein YciE